MRLKVRLFSFLLWVWVGCTSIHAQNLVPNGSFEDKQYCPVGMNNASIRTLIGWTQATKGTPDHFDACNSNQAGVPTNFAGAQNALDGTGYAGMITYTSTKRNYREYLQAKLTRPLSGGEIICVEFWISSAEHSLYVTDAFGVHFSQNAVSHRTHQPLDVQMQMSNPRLHIVDQHDRWVKLSDTFVAKGGEQYITLGNFLPDDRISRLKRTLLEGALESSKWAYVYIDQVVVRSVKDRTECSCVNDQIRAGVHDPPLQLSETEEVSLNTVYFAFDDSTLSVEARKQLDGVANVLRKTPYSFVRVMGHTDVIGREGYNVGLSANRAKSVVAYLAYIGIDPERLEIDFYGSELPAADNSTPEGRAQNRRVEFSVLTRRYVAED